MEMELTQCDYVRYTKNQPDLYDDDAIDTFENDQEQYCHSTIDEKDDQEFFLLYFLPKLPTPSDTRYAFIRDTVKDPLDRNRCIEFETMARDKDNVYAIENAIDFYGKNLNIFQKLDQAQSDTEIDLTKIDYEIRDKMITFLKSLRLIEYKYYHDEDKFIHWSINPFIYEIINYFNPDDSVYNQYKVHNLVNNEEMTSYQIDDLESKRKWFQATEFLNEKIFCTRSVVIDKRSFEKKFSESPDTYNQYAIEHRLIRKYVYPKIHEQTRLVIEVEMSSSKKALQEYVKDLIERMYATNYDENHEQLKYTIDDEDIGYHEIYVYPPRSLVTFSVQESPRIKYEDKFFVYDYYTYRMEQISHRQKYLKDEYESYDDESSYNKKDDVFYQNKSAIYRELISLTTLKEDSIQNYIQDITTLIHKSKTTSYFL